MKSEQTDQYKLIHSFQFKCFERSPLPGLMDLTLDPKLDFGSSFIPRLRMWKVNKDELQFWLKDFD